MLNKNDRLVTGPTVTAGGTAIGFIYLFGALDTTTPIVYMRREFSIRVIWKAYTTLVWVKRIDIREYAADCGGGLMVRIAKHMQVFIFIEP